MKHLLTLTALLISSLAMGQNVPGWNPDANGDDLIGAEDLQSFLAVYNTMLTSSQTVVGYVTDLDSAGTFTPWGTSTVATYYSVPDSVDFLCFPPGEGGTGVPVFVVLNSNTRNTLTTTTSEIFNGIQQDSIISVSQGISPAASYNLLVTWLFIDGRWWAH